MGRWGEEEGSWELGVGEEESEENEGKSAIVLDTYSEFATLFPTRNSELGKLERWAGNYVLTSVPLPLTLLT
ncbi:hypothetical protein, partial [Geitlerinema calcuttense]